MRALYDIADDIVKCWPNVSPWAKPYLNAMFYLGSIEEPYYEDSGESIVRYFLSNATGWRGEDAKRIKAELRAML